MANTDEAATTDRDPILPISRARVFFMGGHGDQRLRHPEGVAVAADGAVWCGGEEGEIYRIEPDGSRIAAVASTGGFTLGLAFDPAGRLYACDGHHKAVFRYDPANGTLERFAEGGDGGRMRAPNFPVVDTARRCLYVSDSYAFTERGPGVWRFDLDTGQGGLWFGEAMTFANGMALAPDGASLYVAETFARRVVRIPINADGAAGTPEPVAEGIERLPDGLAFDVEGNLYIACYEPSRLFRLGPAGELRLLIDDEEAHTFCHPTNCAFRGDELFTANLGRNHITRVAVGIAGLPLPR